MRIKSIRLLNFKRYTDLQVIDLPETARLVVLVGPNGCGKSSLFDAFIKYRERKGNIGISYDFGYYSKAKKWPFDIIKSVDIQTDNDAPGLNSGLKCFYIRTAYRNSPNFRADSIGLGRSSVLTESRFHKMIDNDDAVEANYKRAISASVEDVYVSANPRTSIGEYRENILGEIREAMKNLFDSPPLILESLGNPAEKRTFTFTKGEAAGFQYQNLSGGEKSAFDLLFDIYVKRREFDDTVFCIDEPEAHMSNRLQAGLLEAICGLINEKSQLWIATHSIGMMRKAFDMHKQNPGSVAFLDFTGKDFDQPQVIRPTEPNARFWESIHEIALDDMASLVMPNRIVACEGRPDFGGFDAQCYARIFSTEFPDTKFVSVGNCHDVAQGGAIQIIKALSDQVDIVRVIDLDDRTPEEAQDMHQKGVRVLARRSIEYYLLDDEVLRHFCKINGKDNLADAIVQAKIAAQSPATKIKEVAEKLRQWVKYNFGADFQPGSSRNAFLRDCLAVSFTPEMGAYKELKDDIFGS